MHLARLRLDPAHPQARRDLASAYEMHRTLSRAFAKSSDRAPARFLWRLEPQAVGYFIGTPPTVLVQSAEPGDWGVLDGLPRYLCGPAEAKQVQLDRLLQPTSTCVFRLLCNPTVTRGGKRLGLMREGEQREWLRQQGLKHGFAIASARVNRSERMSWPQGRGGQRITVQVVQFDGILRVVDSDKCATMLVRGIGHAKALGLGMLSLAPTRTIEVS